MAVSVALALFGCSDSDNSFNDDDTDIDTPASTYEADIQPIRNQRIVRDLITVTKRVATPIKIRFVCLLTLTKLLSKPLAIELRE